MNKSTRFNLVVLLTITILILIGIGMFFIFIQQSITSYSASGYANFQVNGQQSITYSTPIDNFYGGFLDRHFLEDNGAQMCSTCDFSSTGFKWTTATTFLRGWEHFGRRVNYECTDPNGCESYKDATKVMNCEVNGNINYLCASDYIKADRCTPTNHPYSFKGTVSYIEGNGFVCNIGGAKKQLLDELPDTFTRPDGETRSLLFLGFDGTVTFTKIIPECSSEETRCIGTVSQECIGLLWTSGEIVLGECGVECLSGEQCIEKELSICQNNVYVNKGEVSGKCEVGQVTGTGKMVLIIVVALAGILVLMVVLYLVFKKN